LGSGSFRAPADQFAFPGWWAAAVPLKSSWAALAMGVQTPTIERCSFNHVWGPLAGQLNLDFMFMLMLSALWVAWRAGRE